MPVVTLTADLPCAQCARPAARSNLDGLHCGACQRNLCRNCINDAFDPAGTAGTKLYRALSNHVNEGRFNFRCHLCAPEPRCLAQQLHDQKVALHGISIQSSLLQATLHPATTRARLAHQERLLSDDEDAPETLNGQDSGPPAATSGPPAATSGPPAATSGPPAATSGPPAATSGPPAATSGPPAATSGPPAATSGPPAATSGPPAATSGPPAATSGPPAATSGPPAATSGPPAATSGPPAATSGPPAATSGPPAATSGPPAATSGPPAATSGPPAATSGPPAATSGPPAATSGPPAATSGPPAATSGPPAATSGPPAATHSSLPEVPLAMPALQIPAVADQPLLGVLAQMLERMDKQAREDKAAAAEREAKALAAAAEREAKVLAAATEREEKALAAAAEREEKALAAAARQAEQDREEKRELRLLLERVSLNRPSHSADAAETLDNSSAILRKSLLNAMELPRFHGDPAAFPDFWSTFILHVDKQNTSALNKFQVLKGLLSGSALRKIEALDSTNPSSYESGKKIIEETYGNVQDQKDAALAKLNSLPILYAHDFDSLDSFSDGLRTSCERLRHINNTEGTEEMGLDLFVPQVLAKLPPQVQDEIKSIRNLKGQHMTPTMMELHSHLSVHLRALRNSRASTPPPPSYNRDYALASQSLLNSSTSNSNHQGPKKNPYLSKKGPCTYCGADATDHRALGCTQVTSYEARMKIIQERNLCLNCLSTRHVLKNCPSLSRCLKCEGKHHTTIHRDEHARAQASFTNPPVSGITLANSANLDYGVIQPTFHALARNPTSGNGISTFNYLDQGSTYSCIDAALSDRLQLKSLGKSVIDFANCHSDTTKKVSADKVMVELVTLDGRVLTFPAFRVGTLAPPIALGPVKFPAATSEALASYKCLANRPPEVTTNFTIGMLLGNDVWSKIMGPPTKRDSFQSGLLAYHTAFGTILSGPTSESSNLNFAASFMNAGSRSVPEDPLQAQLDKLTSLDLLGLAEDPSTRLLHCDELNRKLLETTTRTDDNRIEVRLPYKTAEPQIPSNFGQALGRLRSSLNKCSVEDKTSYMSVFEGYKEDGIIEVVDSKAPAGPLTHYLPHFPVRKESSQTTKIRPVVDAAARTFLGTSLNDLLHKGPQLTEDLLKVLLRHRLHPVAIQADIRQAFLQISVSKPDRDALRIVLPKDISKPLDDNNWQIWRFTRLVMGATCSPWILNYVHRLLVEEARRDPACSLSPAELDRLLLSIYVDDVMLGCETAEDARRLCKGLQDLYNSARMRLRSFSSNAPTALSSLPSEDCNSESENKLLGLRWKTNCDGLTLSPVHFTDNEVLTKRILLSNIAQVFDPLGWFAPLLLRARLLLHGEWTKKCGWDVEVPSEIQVQWASLLCDFNKLHETVLPRPILQDWKKPVRLVAFSDASPMGYGFCIYVWQGINGCYTCNLAFGKARVAPTGKKEIASLPRLELLAAHAASKGLTVVKSALSELEVLSVTLYVDSQIALAWLKNGYSLRPYESKRVKEIHESGLRDFRYVPTAVNVSDISTRGDIDLHSLLNSPYFTGPTFLQCEYGKWECWSVPQVSGTDKELLTGVPRLKPAVPTLLNVAAEKPKPPFGLDLLREDNFLHLLRVTSYASRFANKTGHSMNSLSISSSELDKATLLWIAYIQVLHFPEVLSTLSAGKKNNLIRQLDLTLCDGLIRLGGRISNAKIAEESKHPLLLPHDSPFTRLLIIHIHTSECHAFPKTTLSNLRDKYWITRGLSTVSNTIKLLCALCRLVKGTALRAPPHGPLPDERLLPGPAWSSCGWDYLGPIVTTHPISKETSKRWVSLFACTVTRAIHLEVVWDCSAKAAFNCLERFFSRRGLTQGAIYLDNALQFQTTATVVGSIWDQAAAAEILKGLPDFLSGHRFSFKFIPPRSPFYGGFYERLVGVVKSALRPCLWKAVVTDDELLTLVTRIEAMTNTRPLTHPESDFGDEAPLTPAHFVSPIPNLGLPPLNSDDFLPPSGSTAADLVRSRHRATSRILDDYWIRFNKHYLQELRASHRPSKASNGSLEWQPVLNGGYLLTDNTPRGLWKTVRVVKLYPDPAGIVRYVDVRSSTGHVSKRSVRHLVPFELDAEEIRKLGVSAPSKGPTHSAEDDNGAPVSVPTLSARDERALRRARRQELRDA